MSQFISRFNKWTSVGSTVPDGHAKVNNFNNYDDLTDAEYLIIGTLTPCSGRNEKCYSEGYFYCSKGNWMYEFIDYAFKGDGNVDLETAKREFRKKWGDPANIKEILHKRHIAFLDVVGEAIVHIDDPSDDAIVPFVLDKDNFLKQKEKIECLINNHRVVANSKNAAEGFKAIMGDKKQIPVIPQRIRRHFTDFTTKDTYASKDDLRKGWDNFFNRKGYWKNK